MSCAEEPLRPAELGASLNAEVCDLGQGACVIRLAGEIDLTTAAALKSQLGRLGQGGQERFAVSLAGVRFMDSTGLSVLIGFQKSLPAGGALVLAEVPSAVATLFHSTGLDSRFELLTTIDDAIGRVTGAVAQRPPAVPQRAATA